MHERSIVRQLVKQVIGVMHQHHSPRVTAIRISVGEFSGIEAELLRTAFYDMCSQTPVQGAELCVQTVPLEATCEECQYEFVVKDFRFLCPTCESQRVRILRGDSLMLESIALEDNSHE